MRSDGRGQGGQIVDRRILRAHRTIGGVDRGLVEQHAVRIGAELADPEIRIELRVFDTDDAARGAHQLRRFARERRRQRQQQRGGDQGTGGTETHL